jgi:hypothetical protein
MASSFTNEDRAFISFIIDVFVNLVQTRPQLSLQDFTDHFLALDAMLPANLYRKQYGNMKQCFKNGKIEAVFRLDGNIAKAVDYPQLEAAVQRGALSQEDHVKLAGKVRELEEYQKSFGN